MTKSIPEAQPSPEKSVRVPWPLGLAAGFTLLVLLAVGCGRQPPTATPTVAATSTPSPSPTASPTATATPTGPLVIVGSESFSQIEPFRPRATIARTVAGTLYDTLLSVDPHDGSLRPGVASTWTVSNDDRTITFSLPPNLRWSDGEALTADDVVFSIEQALAENHGENIGPYLHLVSDVAARDAQHIQVRLERGFCPALYDLAAVPIVPQHTKEDTRQGQVTEGAYLRPDQGQLLFARNPRHSPAPALFESWTYRAVTETTAIIDAVNKGSAAVGLLPAETALSDLPAARWVITPSNRLTSLAYRLDHPILRDRRVRQALAQAVDRDALVRTLFGVSQPLPRTHLPPGHWAAQQAPPPAYDPTQAARLLEQAGWVDHDGDGIRDREGQPLRLQLMAPLGSQRAEDIPLYLREQLRAIGVDLQPQFTEPLIFRDNLYHDQYDIALVTWEVGVDPDQYDLWHSGGENGEPVYNFTGYHNAAVDGWLEEARVTPACDPLQRRALYGNIWDALRRDQPYTVLFAWPQILLARQGLAGPAPSPFVGPLWNLETWRWSDGTP
ncbi:MAG: hypothetical protein GXP41_05375 [Chloroflexi bacterium]|nr:hypothetical protein [Chloroflexota bacterium]